MNKSQTISAIEQLRELLKPNATVYTDLKHVSRSGMSRAIAVKLVKDNEIANITWLVGQVTGYKMSNNHDGLNVSGAGMDMGFHLIYGLSRQLYPHGFECIGTDCPSNDHSNGDRNYKPHHHTDGGYALNQRWL